MPVPYVHRLAGLFRDGDVRSAPAHGESGRVLIEADERMKCGCPLRRILAPGETLDRHDFIFATWIWFMWPEHRENCPAFFTKDDKPRKPRSV